MSETALKAIHPVYVDGPLKGQDFPVAADAWLKVNYIDNEADPDEIVAYTLRRFILGDGVALWLGVSEPGEPDVEVLADLLLSDAAKAARVQ